jgi:hypothetical protein
MVEPVVAQDGNTYERAEIIRWLDSHDSSPLDPSCRLDASRLVVNRSVQQQVEDLVESGELDLDMCFSYWERKHALVHADAYTQGEDDIGSVLSMVETKNGSDDGVSIAPAADTDEVAEEATSPFPANEKHASANVTAGEDVEIAKSGVESGAPPKPSMKEELPPPPARRAIWSFSSNKDAQIGVQTEGSTTYWILEIEPPPKAVSAEDAEGMLVWFEEGSVIGVKEEMDAATKANFTADLPRVTFFVYNRKVSARRKAGGGFGLKINDQHAKQLFEDDLQPAGRHGKMRMKHKGNRGKPGQGYFSLYSRQRPLYVQDDKLSCVMCVHCPAGFTCPSFTVKACWTGETPLQMIRGPIIRAFNWVCNLVIYICLVVVIFDVGSYSPLAFRIFFGTAILKSTANAIYTQSVAAWRYGYDLKDLISRWGCLQAIQVTWSRLPKIVARPTASKKQFKVQPVLQPALKKAIVMARASSESESESESEAYSKDESDDSSYSDFSDAPAEETEQIKEPKEAKQDLVVVEAEMETTQNDDADAVFIATATEDVGSAILSYDYSDDIGEVITVNTLDTKKLDGWDSIVAAKVTHILKKRRTKTRTQAAAHLSEYACFGIVSPTACARVIAAYTPSDTRFRMTRICLHLSRLVRAARQRIARMTLIHDVLLGPKSIENLPGTALAMAARGGGGRASRRSATPRTAQGGGLDAFKMVMFVEEEAQKQPGSVLQQLCDKADAALRVV